MITVIIIIKNCYKRNINITPPPHLVACAWIHIRTRLWLHYNTDDYYSKPNTLIAGTIIIIMIRILPRQTLLPWLSIVLMLPVRAISVRLKNGGRIAINDFCRRRIHQSLVAQGTIKCVGGGGVQLRASMWFILLLLLTCCCAITLLTSWCIRPIRSNGPCRHILVPPWLRIGLLPTHSHTPRRRVMKESQVPASESRRNTINQSKQPNPSSSLGLCPGPRW